jgi:hypothetical protein
MVAQATSAKVAAIPDFQGAGGQTSASTGYAVRRTRQALSKQAQLVGVRGGRNTSMGTGIEARLQTGKATLEVGQRASAASRKAHFFPDLIEAARIAGVAALQVDGSNSEPSRDPDIDRVVLGQWSPGNRWRGFDKKRGGHGFQMLCKDRPQWALDAERDPRLIARNI